MRKTIGPHRIAYKILFLAIYLKKRYLIQSTFSVGQQLVMARLGKTLSDYLIFNERLIDQDA